MAQKAKKDRARSNATALNNLHVGSLIVNALFILFTFLRRRSLIAYALVSIPSFLCQLTLEQAGRPKYEANGSLKSSGEDLAAPGLTEYMFDVIWVTWGTLILVILFGNTLFLVWLIIPAYGAYKGFGLLSATRKMAGMQGMDTAGSQTPGGNRKQRRAV